MKCFTKIVLGVAFSLTTFAQDPATNQVGRTNIPGTRTNAIPSRAPQRFDRAALDISPEHRSKLEKINRAYTTNATPAYQRLSALRREMETLINQDTVAEDVLRAKAKEIGDVEGELAIARADRKSVV